MLALVAAQFQTLADHVISYFQGLCLITRWLLILTFHALIIIQNVALGVSSTFRNILDFDRRCLKYSKNDANELIRIVRIILLPRAFFIYTVELI